MKDQIMKMFNLSDVAYNRLKWTVSIVLPAIITFFGILGQTMGWDFTDKVITIGTAFVAMLGVILGISTNEYNKNEENKEENKNE